jgi:voltage-gated potassium channel
MREREIPMASAEDRIRIYLAILITVIVIGISGFVILEGLSPTDALYFVIVTIATVGYGDITPHTLPGKILIILLILAGVGSFVAVAANAFEIMLDRREKAVRMRKVNMIIGVFFEEAGASLLRMVAGWDPRSGEIRDRLAITAEWSDREFRAVKDTLRGYPFQIDRNRMDRAEIYRLLVQNRDFQIQLLQNPVLFEHDDFSDLLQAVFHLTEELSFRKEYQDLPERDLDHLKGDVERVYRLLFYQWLWYMKHLKNHYPYLFSLAIRTNPFDKDATPVFS